MANHVLQLNLQAIYASAIFWVEIFCYEGFRVMYQYVANLQAFNRML
ncbi:hypothetical protein ACCAA_180030 [Candidatus Accumulibacter aalborgensis]|uniref:Uncharacterized protein n=1 Tax=Candidatus Accumulibacter aalborgensis TaxID=1860102 RepID=A0A1A8XHS3_9PROT|nr:hypothetical protein ACCAA_180030 [Candidatus Accumulibacter aalborgensis]